MVAGGAMWFAVAIIASLFISEPCLHAAKPRGVKPQPRNLFIDTTHTRALGGARTVNTCTHLSTFLKTACCAGGRGLSRTQQWRTHGSASTSSLI